MIDRQQTGDVKGVATHAGQGVPTRFCDRQVPWRTSAVEKSNGRNRHMSARQSDLGHKARATLTASRIRYPDFGSG